MSLGSLVHEQVKPRLSGGNGWRWALKGRLPPSCPKTYFILGQGRHFISFKRCRLAWDSYQCTHQPAPSPALSPQPCQCSERGNHGKQGRIRRPKLERMRTMNVYFTAVPPVGNTVPNKELAPNECMQT